MILLAANNFDHQVGGFCANQLQTPLIHDFTEDPFLGAVKSEGKRLSVRAVQAPTRQNCHFDHGDFVSVSSLDFQSKNEAENRCAINVHILSQQCNKVSLAFELF